MIEIRSLNREGFRIAQISDINHVKYIKNKKLVFS